MRIGISTAQCGQLRSRPWRGPRSSSATPRCGCWSACRPPLDPIAVLSATAAVTTRARLGAGVVVVPGEPAAALARSLTTVDVLSDGRLTVALTSGPRAPESCVEEALDFLDTWWRDGPPPPPAQRPRPPVLLTGRTPDALDRVARRADGWSPVGLPVDALGPPPGHPGRGAGGRARRRPPGAPEPGDPSALSHVHDPGRLQQRVPACKRLG